MYPLVSRVISAIDATFGACSICMGQSLAAALVAWGLYVVGWLIWPDSLLQVFLGLSALALTSLWALHVATYAARAVIIARRKKRQAMEHVSSSKDPTRTGAGVERQFDRRAAFGIFLKAAGAAVFASMAFWPLTAGANQHSCADGSACESGYKCCWNSLSEAYFCCNESHACCTDGHSSYCRNPDIGEYC